MKKINLKNFTQFLIIGLFGVHTLILFFQHKLNFFINPRYVPFSISAGFFAVFVGFVGMLTSLRLKKRASSSFSFLLWLKKSIFMDLLLIFVVTAGILISPKQLSSVTASQRANGVSNFDMLTSKENKFFTSDYSKFSLGDWAKSMAENPDLKFYEDKPVSVSGFVYKDTSYPDGHFFVTRFWIVCCAVDATPLSLIVRSDIPEGIKTNDWIQVDGHFEIVDVDGSKAVVIVPKTIEKIQQPHDPYIY